MKNMTVNIIFIANAIYRISFMNNENEFITRNMSRIFVKIVWKTENDIFRLFKDNTCELSNQDT